MLFSLCYVRDFHRIVTLEGEVLKFKQTNKTVLPNDGGVTTTALLLHQPVLLLIILYSKTFQMSIPKVLRFLLAILGLYSELTQGAIGRLMLLDTSDETS